MLQDSFNKNKVLTITGVLFLLLALSWILYALLGHQVISEVYETVSAGPLSNTFQKYISHPLEYYLDKADKLHKYFIMFCIALIAISVLSERTFFIILTIFSISALGFFLFFGINIPLQLDEANSVYLAIKDFGNIIENLENDNSPPVYYFLMAAWVRIFGISEFAARSPSGIFYVLSLIAIYILGKTAYDKKTGLLCSFLYMVSPLAIKYTQFARMYILLGLLGILSTLFFMKVFFFRANTKRYLIFYIIINIIGTFTHYWFFFIILSQIVSYFALLFTKESFKKFLAAMFISTAPFFILWTPMLLIQANNGSISFIDKWGIGLLKDTILSYYFIKEVLIITVFLLLAVFKGERLKITFRNIPAVKEFIAQKQNLMFLILLCTILLVPFIISCVKPVYMPHRYTIAALFAFVMLVGAFLSKFGSRFLVMTCCSFLLITTLTGFIRHNSRPLDPNDRGTVEYLIKHAGDDDILVFTSLSRLTIDYYLRLLAPEKVFTKICFPAETILHPGWRDLDKMRSPKYKAEMEKEADSVISQISDILSKNSSIRIWLFYGCDTEISEVLKDRLDAHFLLKEQVDLKSEWYNVIHVYE